VIVLRHRAQVFIKVCQARAHIFGREAGGRACGEGRVEGERLHVEPRRDIRGFLGVARL
jgi:hypothetical protein